MDEKLVFQRQNKAPKKNLADVHTWQKNTGIFISSRDRGSCWGVSVGRPSSKVTKKIEVVGKRFQLAPPSASGFLLLELGLDGFRKIETTSNPKIRAK